MRTSDQRSDTVRAMITACLMLFTDGAGAAINDDCSLILESSIADETKEGLMDAAARGHLYRVDAGRSSVSFSVQHFPFSSVRGRFHAFDGGLVGIDTSSPDEQILFVIKSDSVDTGDAEINSLIRSASFFDTAMFPDIVFTGRQIELHEGGSASIHGEVTVRNITRPLSLEVELDEADLADRAATGQLHLQAQTRLDRTQHGMDDLQLIVSDTVELELELYLKRVSF